MNNLNSLQKTYLKETEKLFNAPLKELKNNKNYTWLEVPKLKEALNFAENFRQQRQQAIIRATKAPIVLPGLPKTERLPLPVNDKSKEDTSI